MLLKCSLRRLAAVRSEADGNAMYGLVNNGIRNFIVNAHGEEVWLRICEKAQAREEEFENLTAYDDGVTYALVGAVSEVLALSTADVLKVFGQFWVGFSKSTAIGRLIELRGETLMERIRGLDEMHEQIKLTMPHLDPPSFEFEEMPDGNHRLRYISSRDGLAPMVAGLLHGMAEECGVKIEVQLIESRADGAEHDVFNLRILSDVATAA